MAVSGKIPDYAERFSRISRERVVDRVNDAVRQAILDQAFKPGERLEIDELAKRFDVSFTPVRHALQTLNADGLVEIRPRSATFVARFSWKDIAENFDVRRALECLAAETAIPNMPEAAIQRMSELLQEMMRDDITTKVGREHHDERNSEFHRIIVDNSGNRRIRDIYDGVLAQMKIARFHLGRNDWTIWNPSQSEHEDIFKAVEERDAALAIAALTVHINRAKESLETDLKRILSTHT
jgi:DNA-binding GntR family transcriptional regulator